MMIVQEIMVLILVFTVDIIYKIYFSTIDDPAFHKPNFALDIKNEFEEGAHCYNGVIYNAFGNKKNG